MTALARVAAYGSASDGAPRIFGTDLRLRTLMALAKYGPMYRTDLKHLLGGHYLKSEGRDQAPFGRAGLVRTWRGRRGVAVALDQAFPAAHELRLFLIEMETKYRLLPWSRRFAAPKPPETRVWRGDKLALFGSAIPTSILLSTALTGWTFESLCCRIATGYHRENVKKAMKRLETDGVIVGDRKRKPGFNVRVVRLNPQFSAVSSLRELIDACGDAWAWRDRVRSAMAGLHPRMKEHLRRRGLLST